MTAEAPPYPMSRDCPFDPPTALQRLQHDSPVTRVTLWDGTTPWIVTRYDDVRAMLRDPRVSADSDRPGYPDGSLSAATRRKQLRALQNLDDPEHAAQRRLLIAEFSVRRIEGLRGRIQQLVDQLLDDMLSGPKPADIVASLALPVPSTLIGEILGVPREDQQYFQETTKTLVSHMASPEQHLQATNDLLEYMGRLVDEKNARPTDDLISRLATSQLLTGQMSRRDISVIGSTLLQAGHETTANMISLSTAVLLENPEQLRELRESDSPELVSSAVEEALRYLTILHRGRRRVALEDLELGGVLIRKGEGLIAALDLANWDERVFENAATFDIHREGRRHIAFGFGAHQCLGQVLARLELQVVFGTLFRRIPTLRLAVPVSELPFKHDTTVYGLEELPVTWGDGGPA
jgi:cytochrome P450